MDDQRGIIQNSDRAGQLRNFKGLRYGTITPTDEDLSIDFNNKLWVKVELKVEGYDMPDGQRIHFERELNDLSKVKPALGILAWHNHPSHEAIDCANAKVREVWFEGRWWKLTEGHTVKTLIDNFITEPKNRHKWRATPPPIDRTWCGVRCGIKHRLCTFCRGVPCQGSSPWTEG